MIFMWRGTRCDAPQRLQNTSPWRSLAPRTYIYFIWWCAEAFGVVWDDEHSSNAPVVIVPMIVPPLQTSNGAAGGAAAAAAGGGLTSPAPFYLPSFVLFVLLFYFC
jgi:hypothetical protein